MKVTVTRIASVQRIHDTRSEYVERFWLPLVGPTALALARLATSDAGRACDNAAEWIGVKDAVALRAADRLVHRGLAHWTSGDDGQPVLAVYSAQSPVPQQASRRLPAGLQALTDTFTA